MDFRPNRFEVLPIIVKNLLIINALVFLAQTTLSKQLPISLEDTFALHTWQSQLFQPWQLITHMFMHGDFWHLLFNMFALWMFGSTLETLWGPKRFLTFYIICGLGAAFCHLTVLYIESEQLIKMFQSLPYAEQEYNRNAVNSILNQATLGASGAIFGCLTAFAYLFPNTVFLIYGIIPLKAKWALPAYILFELFSAFKNSAGDNVAHFAHLGGALVGFLLVYFWNKNNKKTFY
jgi:membrane associated rhomboid family serine protease